MKKYILLPSLLLGGVLLTAQAYSQSQQDNQQNEEIIIRKKGDFPKNLDIRLNGNKVTINGKKPEDIQGNIEVIRKKSRGNLEESYGFNQSGEPFGGSSHGFSFSPVTPPGNQNKALLGVLTLPGDSVSGARVDEVERGTPADSAGLQKNDIITKVNDKVIRSAEDLSDAIGQYKPDDRVTITYQRNGETREAAVKLGRNDNGGTHFALSAPFDQFHFRGPFGHTDPQNFMKEFRRMHPFMSQKTNNKPRLGMTVESRGDGKGVTVKQVDPGSAAARSGFKSGDILSTFAGQKISGINDVVDALIRHRDDDSVQATVIRNGHDKTLTVEIPEARRQAKL